MKLSAEFRNKNTFRRKAKNDRVSKYYMIGSKCNVRTRIKSAIQSKNETEWLPRCHKNGFI